ncbi:MAG: nuclear transport factor 2 family protein [Bacteroidota bacterium]
MYNDSIKELQDLIRNYFEGIFNGDVDKLESCFTQNAIIYGDIHRVPYKKNIDEYLKGVQNRQSPCDLNEVFQMETIGVDIMGNVAMVKLHVPMLGFNYYDYLSLTKIDTKWKIVNKIFTHVGK